MMMYSFYMFVGQVVIWTGIITMFLNTAAWLYFKYINKKDKTVGRTPHSKET